MAQKLILSTRLGPEVNSPWAGPVQISVEHESEVDEERREEKGSQEVSVGGEANKGTSGKIDSHISQEETTTLKERRKRQLKVLRQV